MRKRKFPYYDESPLAVANTPEVREYMAIGVINDEEIGQMSEIKEIVYAGQGSREQRIESRLPCASAGPPRKFRFSLDKLDATREGPAPRPPFSEKSLLRKMDN